MEPSCRSDLHSVLIKQPPSAPQNVEARVLSDTQVIVSWNPPQDHGGDNVRQYSIQWGSYLLFENEELLPVAGTHNTFSKVISGLMPETEYFFRVFAYNVNGFGACDQFMEYC